jgi:hypothetical protein
MSFYVICVCLRIVMFYTYCVVFLCFFVFILCTLCCVFVFLRLASCLPYVDSFSGLSIWYSLTFI